MHGLSRERIKQSRGPGLTKTLVTPEEESLIATNRPADRPAELIASQRRFGLSRHVREEVGRIELVVPQILEEGAVELVGSRLGHHVRQAACVGSELC